MSTVRLYDPNNEPFDVPETRVSDLVLTHGWTKTPFEVVDAPPPAEEVREELDAEVEPDEEPVEEEDEPDTAPPELGSKRKG